MQYRADADSSGSYRTERIVSQLKWGLIPHWSKDDSFAAKLITARSETLTEKASFKDAFRHYCCLVPASGFYEWKAFSDGDAGHLKQPFYFYLRDKQVFGFASFWEEMVR